MSLSTPVALFIFNRPDLTESVFAAIARVRPSTLFVIADGPRFPAEVETCRMARAVIEKMDWDCQLQINLSDTNLGCKKCVSRGIQWVFSQVDEAIFLEDDTLPNPSFFTFCQSLLDHYRYDKRIMHINGSSFLTDQIKIDSSYYFSRYTFSWGWASWKRAWTRYDPDMRTWPDFKKQMMAVSLFEDPHEQEFWNTMLEETFRGKIDSWDFQMFYNCWIEHGLAISPAVNLVTNLGFRADATHTIQPAHIGNKHPTRALNGIVHPMFMVRNREADTITFDSYFWARKPTSKQDIFARAHRFVRLARNRINRIATDTLRQYG